MYWQGDNSSSTVKNHSNSIYQQKKVTVLQNKVMEYCDLRELTIPVMKKPNKLQENPER